MRKAKSTATDNPARMRRLKRPALTPRTEGDAKPVSSRASSRPPENPPVGNRHKGLRVIWRRGDTEPRQWESRRRGIPQGGIVSVPQDFCNSSGKGGPRRQFPWVCQLAPSPVGFPHGFWRGRTENPTPLNTQESLNATRGEVRLSQTIRD